MIEYALIHKRKKYWKLSMDCWVIIESVFELFVEFNAIAAFERIEFQSGLAQKPHYYSIKSS